MLSEQKYRFGQGRNAERTGNVLGKSQNNTFRKEAVGRAIVSDRVENGGAVLRSFVALES